jgi:hypothetical protein
MTTEQRFDAINAICFAVHVVYDGTTAVYCGQFTDFHGPQQLQSSMHNDPVTADGFQVLL